MTLAMPTVEKYKAKAVYWNTVTKTVVSTQSVEQYRVRGRLDLPQCIKRFDSQHEFKVYLELVRMHGDQCVIRQYPLEIIPPGDCYPKGKTWKVDFAIKHRETSYLPDIFVEAKGAFLSEFASILSSLETCDSDSFDRLYIIFTSKIPTEHRVIKNLLKGSAGDRILTLKELQNTSHLI